MKIHIVQKGDTLWKIAKNYGVDFQELLRANTQIKNPDKIMPGMKVKVPTHSVPLKKGDDKARAGQHPHPKEMPVPVPQPPEKASPMTPMIPPAEERIQPMVPPPPVKEMPMPPAPQAQVPPPMQQPMVQMPPKQPPIMPPMQPPMHPPMHPHPHMNFQMHLFMRPPFHHRPMHPPMHHYLPCPPMMHPMMQSSMYPSSSMPMRHYHMPYSSSSSTYPSSHMQKRKSKCSSCGESSRSYDQEQSSLYDDSYAHTPSPQYGYSPMMPPYHGTPGGSSSYMSGHPHMHSTYDYPSTQEMPSMPERDVWPSWEHGHDESSSSH